MIYYKGKLYDQKMNEIGAVYPEKGMIFFDQDAYGEILKQVLSNMSKDDVYNCKELCDVSEHTEESNYSWEESKLAKGIRSAIMDYICKKFGGDNMDNSDSMNEKDYDILDKRWKHLKVSDISRWYHNNTADKYFEREGFEKTIDSNYTCCYSKCPDDGEKHSFDEMMPQVVISRCINPDNNIYELNICIRTELDKAKEQLDTYRATHHLMAFKCIGDKGWFSPKLKDSIPTEQINEIERSPFLCAVRDTLGEDKFYELYVKHVQVQ